MIARPRLLGARAGLFVLSLLSLTCAWASNSAKTTSARAGIAAAPVVRVIQGTPLEVHVGDDLSFQIFNASVPGSGQIYPDDATDTADMGWFVRANDVLYAPNFGEHSGSATGNLGAYTPFTPGTLSTISGNGSAAAPFQVTTTSTLGTSGLSATQVVSYVNGNNYFTKTFTVTNTGAAQALTIFLGADIFLADSDQGNPYLLGASTSPGGQTCANVTPQYTILLIPQTPPEAYSANRYDNIWGQIGAGTLDNATLADPCIDNGAALQWNRSLASGASATIQTAVSFGDIPPIAQFNITAVNPVSGAAGSSVDVTINGIGFQAGTVFDFGAGIDIGNLVIVNANTATATLAIAATAASGPRDVTAEQTDGGLAAVLPDGFNVTGGTTPAFAVTAVTPVSGHAGDTVNLTISGSGFQAGTTFAFEYGSGDVGIPPVTPPDLVLSNLVIVDANTATVTLQITNAARTGSYSIIGIQAVDTGVQSILQNAFTVLGGSVPPGGEVVPTPTLGVPGLFALMLAFAAFAWMRMRRRQSF